MAVTTVAPVTVYVPDVKLLPLTVLVVNEYPVFAVMDIVNESP